MPAVTVIIPTFNRWTLLQQAIDSVMRQTMNEWKLIVVDDASPDDTSERVGAIADERVSVTRLPQNVGQSAARQVGAEGARTPMLMFLDDDDALRPEALTRLVRALEKNPEAPVAVGANVEFDARGHRRRTRHPRRQVTRVVWPELLWGWSATPSRVLVKADVFEEVGGWDPTIETAHDTELLLRLSLHGPFVLVPSTVLDKRAHEGQSRPEDSQEIRQRFRERWMQDLPDEIRPAAQRVVQARQHTLDGEASYVAGEMSAARQQFLAACTSAPSLLRSPLVRPYLTRDVAKATAASVTDAILGPRRTATIRSVSKKISQRVLRRDPGGDRVMKVREPRPPRDV
jgi:GT2 family glycosyltransferase